MNILMLLRESYPTGFCVMSASLGGIIGSFLGVVAERIPPMTRNEEGSGNLLFPASHCPECGHSLCWWQNIPLVSWCCLRGRCHYCCAPIPLRLLMMELLSALFFGVTAAYFPSFSLLMALWLLWCGLLPLSVIDARYMLLPDSLTLPLLWAGLLFHALFRTMPLPDAIYGAAAGYLSLWLVYWSFRLLTGREGLGYGDFKLLAALGAWCGWQALPSLLLLAALSGIIAHCLFYKSVKKDLHIPFGPFMALAGMTVFIMQSSHFIF